MTLESIMVTLYVIIAVGNYYAADTLKIAAVIRIIGLPHVGTAQSILDGIKIVSSWDTTL